MVSPTNNNTAKRIRVTLVKSPIGYGDGQQAAVRALKLRKLHSSVEVEDTPTIRGQIFKVRHLVQVSEIEDSQL